MKKRTSILATTLAAGALALSAVSAQAADKVTLQLLSLIHI